MDPRPRLLQGDDLQDLAQGAAGREVDVGAEQHLSGGLLLVEEPGQRLGDEALGVMPKALSEPLTRARFSRSVA